MPRQRLDLLPQYARIAASLSTVALSPAASVSAELADRLRAEFRSLLRRKAAAALRKDLVEVRLKNARSEPTNRPPPPPHPPFSAPLPRYLSGLCPPSHQLPARCACYLPLRLP